MPDWVNAASAVLVTSENEGFGLVAVEALACDVPVLSTPVGVAPALLRGIQGCLAEPFDPDRGLSSPAATSIRPIHALPVASGPAGSRPS